ncbi:unnamed protein product [Sphagnum balticum]
MTYFTIAVDRTVGGAVFSFFPKRKSEKPRSALTMTKARFEHWAAPRLLEVFVTLGLARKLSAPDEKTFMLGKFVWDEAIAQGIEVWEWRLFGLPRNTFVAKLRNGTRIAYEGIPTVPEKENRVSWMDDKAELKKEFTRRGLPVAKGGAAHTEKEALKIFRSLTPPVIVKPHAGSGSRHTVLHLSTEEDFIRAFRIAKQVDPYVVIEEEFFGTVFRVTVVDGKFVAALHRDPPLVVGDGVHTIAELVTEENKHPLRKGPYFGPIQTGEKAEAELAWQGYTMESIPEVGQKVSLHQKINWHVGGTTTDVTDIVHPENKALFEKVARTLQTSIVGIDCIFTDITKPWTEQERCGILECNSMPFFENHHLPFHGSPQNVAAKVWEMVS